MKLKLIVSCILLTSVLSYGQFLLKNGTVRNGEMSGRVVSAPQLVKIIDITTPTGTSTLGAGGSEWFAGGIFNLSSGGKITKATFSLTLGNGDVTSKSYTCRIYTLSGNNLDTLVGTSVAISGTNSWNSTPVNFIFSTPVDFSASTSYGIAIAIEQVDDGSNYIILDTCGDSEIIALSKWNSSLGNSDLYTARTPYIQLWAQ